VKVLPARVEPIARGIKLRTIHGWHSSRLVKYDGHLYAAVTVLDPDAANAWKDKGLIYRRQDNGRWDVVGELPNQPYHMMVDPAGRFWVIAPSNYDKCEVFRSGPGGDLSRWELVYNGTCAYAGGAIDPEGNVLLLHALHVGNRAEPNAVVAAYYHAATDTWHTDQVPTHEGRYGYMGMYLDGRRAFAVIDSSGVEPPLDADAEQATPWRDFRMVRFDDLTEAGRWCSVPWLVIPYGWSSPIDMIRDDAGDIHFRFSSSGAVTLAQRRDAKAGYYSARIDPDTMRLEIHEFPIRDGSGRYLRDSAGRWYLLGRKNGYLHLWRLDRENRFAVVDEWRIGGTAGKFQNYVLHTLRPARFGGEADGDTIHVATTDWVRDKARQDTDATLWLATFCLPNRAE